MQLQDGSITHRSRTNDLFCITTNAVKNIYIYYTRYPGFSPLLVTTKLDATLHQYLCVTCRQWRDHIFIPMFHSVTACPDIYTHVQWIHCRFVLLSWKSAPACGCTESLYVIKIVFFLFLWSVSVNKFTTIVQFILPQNWQISWFGWEYQLITRSGFPGRTK
jgi:hypothetical protein